MKSRKNLFVGALMLVAGSLAVAQAPVSAATEASSSYIVVFKKGANARAEADVLRGRGFAVRNVYENVFPGVAVDMPAAAARGLARNPNVQLVESDGVVTKVATQNSATWGLDRSDQRALPLNGSFTYPDTAGQGVRAYIIDTGVRSTHSEFTGRMAPGFTSINDGVGTEDCDGHGTHVAGTVAGTIYGLAKKATVVPVRVLDCSGSGTWSGVIAGLDWVAANAVKPAVANMSLGGGASSSVDTAVTNLHNKGVTVVVAAGNENINACNTSPARAAVAVTVGATSSNDARASFSNFGTCLDIFAPGVGITSSVIGSDTATAAYSGTSMASPHVAGAAALMLGTNTGLTPTQVRDQLVASATQNVVTSAGTGSPNRLLYVEQTVVNPPVNPPVVTAPGAFSKSSPSNGATNVNRRPTFTWSASTDTVSYQVCVSTKTTCTSWTNAGTGTSFTWLTTLSGRKAHYWQVRAVNSAGTTLASGGVWKFTTAR
jgi:serine protease